MQTTAEMLVNEGLDDFKSMDNAFSLYCEDCSTTEVLPEDIIDTSVTGVVPKLAV